MVEQTALAWCCAEGMLEFHNSQSEEELTSLKGFVLLTPFPFISPSSIASFQAPSLLSSEARSLGVLPITSFTLTSAPPSTNQRIHVLLPLITAQCNGVHPSLFFELGLAPCFNNRSMASG